MADLSFSEKVTDAYSKVPVLHTTTSLIFQNTHTHTHAHIQVSQVATVVMNILPGASVCVFMVRVVYVCCHLI